MNGGARLKEQSNWKLIVAVICGFLGAVLLIYASTIPPYFSDRGHWRSTAGIVAGHQIVAAVFIISAIALFVSHMKK